MGCLNLKVGNLPKVECQGSDLLPGQRGRLQALLSLLMFSVAKGACLPASESTSGRELRWWPLLWSELGIWRNSINFVKLLKNKLEALEHPYTVYVISQLHFKTNVILPLKNCSNIVGKFFASPE